ncbi:MAG: DUF5011 domain-containing protein, partial [Candidatus Pacebacteria bacterium]|nr:DUF5011 domain-containing protein [Candidatus Paceibacterota bacterium]
NATSTNLAATNLRLGSLTGVLRAAAGAVSTGLVNLASEVTGVLGVSNGGTGWANVAAGSILFGNGAGSLATTSVGTNGQVLALSNGVPTWVASTTFSSGLSYLNGNVTNTGVTSITGTPNQITADVSTGAVTLSLPAFLGITNASSTALSALEYFAVGRTATTTIRGDVGSVSTFAGSIQTTSINSTSVTATSTFGHGIDIASGCYAVNGACISAGTPVIQGGGALINIQTFTSDGTYTPTAGATNVMVVVTGAGAGGGGADGPAADVTNETVAGGGGAGGTSIAFVDLTGITTVPVEVGIAGTAGSNAGGNGGVGGDSSFGTHATGTGGGVGTGTGQVNATGCAAAGAMGTPGTGGTANTGDINVTGGDGFSGSCLAEIVNGGSGGASYWGGGARGGVDPNGNACAAGVTASAYGAGGGGAACEDSDVGATGGAGAGGVVVVYEYGPTDAVIAVGKGGTGTTTVPTYGQVLVGNAVGGYDLVATSSFREGTTFAMVNGVLQPTTTVGMIVAASSTFSGGLNAEVATTTSLFTANLSIASLTGFLKATAGVVASALIDLASDVTGILGVSNGGTGWSNLATNAVLFGNGTGAVGTTTPGADGEVLALVNGVPTWQATTTLATISGTLTETQGGTGNTTYNTGDILYASGVNTLAKLPIGGAGQVLKVAGGIPSWGSDLVGGGGGGGVTGAWATTTDDLAIYPADTSDVVIVGTNATSTTGSILEVAGQSYFSGNVGVATTSPGSIFSIGNVANFRSTISTLYSGLSVAGDVFLNAVQLGQLAASSIGTGGLSVGTISTSTIQGNTTGTSTIQGFIDVLGTNSTSTFSGGLAVGGLSVSGAATSTFANGINLGAGCFAINGSCVINSVTNTDGSLTVSPTSGAVELELNLAHSNIWSGLQVFAAASSTAFSALDYVSIGRTSTSSIQGGTTGTSTLQGFMNVLGTNSTSTFSGGLAADRIAVTGTGTSTFAGGIDVRGGCIAFNGTCIDTGGAIDGVTVTTFTGSGTWTKSNYAGLTFTQVITTAPGGGGGGADAPDTTNETMGAGGGAGGTAIEMINAASLGTTETVTIGSVGTAGANTGGAGGAGGSASFGAHNSATGGGGGGGSVANATGCAANAGAGTPGDGGAGTGGDINLNGGAGSNGYCAAELVNGGTGGASYWGGGGRGGVNGTASAAGSNGVAYGSGGGGAIDEDSTTGAAGGVGAGGIVVTLNYTSTSGDLAEWYETKSDVEAGDVVAISEESFAYDSRLGLQDSAILEKATPGASLVGVVASAPYETIGGDVLGAATHPRAIALAGRVPVKVSAENGAIEAGDLLTVSSVPGVAMKLQKAGTTIGRALDDMRCKEDGSCSVLVMVSTTYSAGALLNVALRSQGMDPQNISTSTDPGRFVLTEMLQQKRAITATSTLSEIYTDRVVAGLEIITPRVVADTAVLSTIEPVDTDVSLRLGENGVFSVVKAGGGMFSMTFATSTDHEDTLAVSIDALGNAFFAGTLVAANFEVGSPENPGGITMYDAKTHEPYCTQIVGGRLKTIPGACGSVNPLADDVEEVTASDAPQITINGNNPAEISVGAQYVDLGANVTDDVDTNIGMVTVLNGEEVASVTIDTSMPGTHTVQYSATDRDGNVSVATRTVVIISPITATEETSEPEATVVEAEGDEETAPVVTAQETSPPVETMTDVPVVPEEEVPVSDATATPEVVEL